LPAAVLPQNGCLGTSLKAVQDSIGCKLFKVPGYTSQVSITEANAEGSKGSEAIYWHHKRKLIFHVGEVLVGFAIIGDVKQRATTFSFENRRKGECISFTIMHWAIPLASCQKSIEICMKYCSFIQSELDKMHPSTKTNFPSALGPTIDHNLTAAHESTLPIVEVQRFMALNGILLADKYPVKVLPR
jgi:hypothetical protein